MLYLVGLGLAGDLTVEGVRIAKKSRKVYLETYTSLVPEKEKMEEILDRTIILLDRKQIEEEDFLLGEAATEDITILVGGDPLVATTHAELLVRAHRRGIVCRIIHNASIYTAVTETGLQIYRFGKSTSIVFPQKNFAPTSFFYTVQENLSRNLHTLLFLDVVGEEGRFMDPATALHILARLGYSGEVVVCSRLGYGNSAIRYGTVEEFTDLPTHFWGDPPHMLIIPASLHFMEEEMLERFRIKKK
jgi:diphthine synthase